MADAETFAFDDVLAGRGHVDQQIDEMVLKKIDLVGVEETATGARQQAGLEALDALRQRAFEIERADDAIVRRAQRQVDDRCRGQADKPCRQAFARARRGSHRRARGNRTRTAIP